MKSALLFALVLTFSANIFGQTRISQISANHFKSNLLMNEVNSTSLLNILRFSTLEASNTEAPKEYATAFPSARLSTDFNNPYIHPLQMVNNLGVWCPQESFNSPYFVDKIDYKTMSVGNLKMNAFYVFDNMGNLRSTSTSFSKD